MSESSEKVSIIIPAYGQKHLTIKCLETLEGPNQIIVIDDRGGFATTVNKGLSIADGEILIICNNDIEFVDPHWLHHLIGPLLEGYDICSIRTTDSDGWTTEDRLEEGAKFGSIWAMKRKVYETIGGLDESFGKGYAEDLDYRRRALNAGLRIVKNHAGLVEHHGKATFKVIDPEDDSYHRAMERYREKWGFIE
jgi:GT2 family glycosyltransferase